MTETTDLKTPPSHWDNSPGARAASCVRCGSTGPLYGKTRYCPACRNLVERERARKMAPGLATKPCVVDGCSEPRHVTGKTARSRCFEHYRTKAEAEYRVYCERQGLPEPFYPPEPPEGTQWCRTCRALKPIGDFGRRGAGIKVTCKACENLVGRGRYQDHLEARRAYGREAAVAARQRAFLKKFGITWDDFAAIIERQHGLCLICGCEQGGGASDRLVPDHCHVTGRFRGAICTRCNSALGLMVDIAEIARRAALYLEGVALEVPEPLRPVGPSQGEG